MPRGFATPGKGVEPTSVFMVVSMVATSPLSFTV
jgi:hypothetical protein